jgi:hypothetical protein
MVTWQVGPLQVVQSLPHAPKMKPEAGVGVAVRVVVEPVVNESEQVPP